MHLCEKERQTLEAFAAANRLYTKFDCSVVRQKFSILVTAHDCVTGLLENIFFFHSLNIIFWILGTPFKALSKNFSHYIKIYRSPFYPANSPRRP